MNTLRYIPPDAPAVDLVDRGSGTYLLTSSLAGLLTSMAAMESTQSPGQYGASALAVTVAPRTVTSVVHIFGDSQQQVWQHRQALAAAMWLPASRPGVRPTVGTLRLSRDGHDDVEVSAAPVNSPRADRWLSERVCEVEIEWWIPDPRWRGVADQTVTLQEGGGFSFPLSHPWSSLSANLTAEIDNTGTAEAPIVARIYGPVTTPRLILVDTAEFLELSGAIADGDYIEVDTGFARKTVTYVTAAGVSSNAMGRLNLDKADFWQLPRGVSEVRFEADVNDGGFVYLTWRPRFAGV